MRKNLGRFFIILSFVLNPHLFASTYEWSASVNKKSAYVNEALFLKYVCSFSDRSELYSIDFKPVGEYEDYTLKPLSEKESIIDGKRVNVFEYIAYAKRSGQIVFDFDMTMKKTNRASIENTVLGRDNEQYEEFTSKYLRQKSLIVDVKPSETDLVGAFDLQIKQSQASVKAYEPYSLEFIIQGRGNFEKLKPITFQIDGVKVFSQKQILKSFLKKDGEHGLWSQKFAFVSDKSFVIPALEFEYFDLEKSSKEVLRFKGVAVEVIPAYKKADLLDEDEKSFDFKAQYVYYLLTFMLGFVVAKIEFKKRKKHQSKEALLCQKIQSAKSLEELSMLLALQSSKKYEKILLKIEKGELTSLKDAQKLICG